MFQERTSPESKRPISRQTNERDYQSWLIEYEVLDIRDYDFNMSIFWEWLFFNERFHEKARHVD